MRLADFGLNQEQYDSYACYRKDWETKSCADLAAVVQALSGISDSAVRIALARTLILSHLRELAEQGRTIDELEIISKLPQEYAPNAVRWAVAQFDEDERIKSLSAGETVPTAIEKFRILKPLGDPGGQGRVYEAEDPVLKRRVAIKVLYGPHPARLERELRAAAPIEHPNVVRIYETGRSEENRAFIVMERISGPRLDVFISQQSSLAPIVQVFREIALGTHVVHEHGIIHRDLKPSNIVCDSADCPKLLDFGLARHLNGPNATTTGLEVGSRGYMSPEQRKDPRSVTVRSDVFSIGVMLYQALSDRLPFSEADFDHAGSLIPPTPPSQLGRFHGENSRDLDAVTLKCLSELPNDRYASAAELASDLSRVLERLPVEARKTGVAERAIYAVRRHPWKYASAAAVAIGLIISSASFGISYFRTTIALDRERRSKNQATTQRNIAMESFIQLATDVQNALGDEKPKDRDWRQSLRHQVLDIALKGMDRIENSSSQDPELDLVVAASIRKRGDFYGLVDEPVMAHREYKRAIARGMTSSNPEIMREVAICYSRLAELAVGISTRDTLGAFDRNHTHELDEFANSDKFHTRLGTTLVLPLGYTRDLEQIYLPEELEAARQYLLKAYKVCDGAAYDDVVRKKLDLAFLCTRLADVNFHMANEPAVTDYANKSLTLCNECPPASMPYEIHILRAKNLTLLAWVETLCMGDLRAAGELWSTAWDALKLASNLRDPTKLSRDALSGGMSFISQVFRPRVATIESLKTNRDVARVRKESERAWERASAQSFMDQPKLWSPTGEWYLALLYCAEEPNKLAKKKSPYVPHDRRVLKPPSADSQKQAELRGFRMRMLPYESFGKLEVGMTVEQVEALLGPADKRKELFDLISGGGEVWYYRVGRGTGDVSFDAAREVTEWHEPMVPYDSPIE